MRTEWGQPDWGWSYSIWNGTGLTQPNPDTPPIDTPPNPNGLQGGLNTPIGTARFPQFINASGELMYAAAARAANVYGLFARDDGSDLHWDQLGSIGTGENAKAVSTRDGNSIFIGTDQGNLYRFDAPYTNGPTQLSINAPSVPAGGRWISAVVEIFPTVAFATLNVAGNGYVLSWLGQEWDLTGGALPNDLTFQSLAVPDLGSLYAVTTQRVYVSHDLGASWATASDGLPTMPHATDLRFATQPSGGYLYLSTYGRSLWRAKLF
jgi:hypothetical protein